MNVETIYQPSNIQFESIKEYLETEKINGNLPSVIGSFERNELTF